MEAPPSTHLICLIGLEVRGQPFVLFESQLILVTAPARWWLLIQVIVRQMVTEADRGTRSTPYELTCLLQWFLSPCDGQ